MRHAARCEEHPMLPCVGGENSEPGAEGAALWIDECSGMRPKRPQPAGDMPASTWIL